ncbi:MAG TPA: potassium channel family protein [Dehalococcoidia bacterium]|nr:potassium channel family protein [Dehalococcoidia bacterium]
MSARRRLLRAALAVLALLALGTAGFALVERIDPFDALYQSVVTIATAGIERPQVTTVAGKLLTIVLLVIGAGVLVYTAGTVAQLALEGEFAAYFGGQRMRGRVEALRDHFIICGFGRVGEEVATELAARGMPFVVVDTTPERVTLAERRGYLVSPGDATRDETLIGAGVQRARCLIAASDTDANNTYIVLSAKSLNPALFIVARAGQAENERKLRQAGANRVVSPYLIAGRQMALWAIQPLFVDALQASSAGESEPILAQLLYDAAEQPTTVARLLAACPTTTVLALRRAGELIVAPQRTHDLAGGDELIVLGPEAELAQIHAGGVAVPARLPPRGPN